MRSNDGRQSGFTAGFVVGVACSKLHFGYTALVPCVEEGHRRESENRQYMHRQAKRLCQTNLIFWKPMLYIFEGPPLMPPPLPGPYSEACYQLVQVCGCVCWYRYCMSDNQYSRTWHDRQHLHRAQKCCGHNFRSENVVQSSVWPNLVLASGIDISYPHYQSYIVPVLVVVHSFDRGSHQTIITWPLNCYFSL